MPLTSGVVCGPAPMTVDSDADAVGVTDLVCEGVAEGEAVCDAVSVSVDVALGDEPDEAVGDDVAVADRVGVGDGVSDCVSDAVGVGEMMEQSRMVALPSAPSARALPPGMRAKFWNVAPTAPFTALDPPPPPPPQPGAGHVAPENGPPPPPP